MAPLRGALTQVALIATLFVVATFIPSDNLSDRAFAQQNLSACMIFSDGQPFGKGAMVKITNNCGTCVEFGPRVRWPDGNMVPMSTTVALGAPVLSMKMQPGTSQVFFYSSRGAGVFVPVVSNPKAC